jgi:hypothetical protein
LWRLDTGEAYLLDRMPGGRWQCGCPAWRYRKSAERAAGCKHTLAVAALSLYDTAKAFDRAARIDGLRLLAKSGGRSGDYRAP